MGLRYDDFCRLDFAEFSAVWQAYAEQRDANFKDEWQRMRMLATIVIQPHLSKGRKVTPEKLLPFPWDKQQAPKPQAPKLTATQHRKRMEELVAKLGDKLV